MYGRRPTETEKINSRLLVWITPTLREKLNQEAAAAGYDSLGAFIREVKLGGCAHDEPHEAGRHRDAHV